MSIDNTTPSTNVIPGQTPDPHDGHRIDRGEIPLFELETVDKGEYLKIREKNDVDLEGAEYVAYLRVRLPRLLEIADTLVKAGFRVFPTLTGIGFEAPEGFLDVDEDDDEDDPCCYLKRLGIDEPVSVPPSRTSQEVSAAMDEIHDRVWYERTARYLQDPDSTIPPGLPHGEIAVRMLESMQRHEAKYGRESLDIENDFDRGMLNGKLSALRWVQGEHWDFLDT